jgi:dipeptidyl aminopeptidase/acylaminoacyl peptidase
VAALIDPEICIAGRELTEPTLSPNGRLIACVTAEAGMTAIRVVPVEGGPERVVTALPQPAAGRGLGGGCLTWIDDGDALMYVGRDSALWTAPVTGGERRLVMAAGTGMAAPMALASGSLAVVSRDHAEIWLLWPKGGYPALRLDTGQDDFVCDPHIAWVTKPGEAPVVQVVWQAWNVPDMAWDHSVVRRVQLRVRDGARTGDPLTGPLDVLGRDLIEGTGAILQPRSLPDGRLTSVRDDHGWLNVWLDDQVLISESYEHAGPTWGSGLRSYVWSPDGSAVAFARNERGFGRLCVVRLATGEVTEIARGVHGHLDWKGEHLVAVRSGARTPTQIVSYRLGQGEPFVADPAGSRRVHLIGPVTAWDGIELPEPEVHEVPVDYVTLQARIYRAPDEKRIDAAVIWVHGGPTDQWQVTFMPRVAWLWGRGCDVVVVDPRGSTGHGRSYQQALRGQWGERDAHDTAALIAAYQKAGGVRPDRTVIAGSSSGGLTVLSVLRHHGNLVAGGIAISPVSDLADLSERSHRYEAHYNLTLVGEDSDQDRYRELSPVHHAAEIRGPLMILHGQADPVVPADHSRVLAEQIAAAGGQVDLHLFADEGHGLRQIPNRLEEFRLIAEFLDRVFAA